MVRVAEAGGSGEATDRTAPVEPALRSWRIDGPDAMSTPQRPSREELDTAREPLERT